MLLAVSDTHGHRQTLALIAGIVAKEKPRLLVHAGDTYRDFLWLQGATGTAGYGVLGNCDHPFLAGGEEVLFQLAGKKILLVHGHQYGVKAGHTRLVERAKERGADAAIFGHSHIPLCAKVNGVWLLNPGSIPRPRGNGSPGYVRVLVDRGQLLPELVQI